MNWLTKWWNRLWKKPEIQECRCWSSEVMEIATQIAIATEETKTSEHSHSYNSFSGCDVKVYLSDEPDIKFGYKNADEYLEWHQRYKCVPEVQAVSFKVSLTTEVDGVGGTLMVVMFSKSLLKTLLEYKHMHLIVANEYGYLAYMSIKHITWQELSYGIAIDDIISEERFDFVAQKIVPWQAVR